MNIVICMDCGKLKYNFMQNEVKSARLMLELAQNEYEFEDQRRESIDSKCGTLLSLLGIFIPAIDGYIALSGALSGGLDIWLFIFSAVLQIGIIYCLCRVLFAHSYERIGYHLFIDKSLIFEDDGMLAAGVARKLESCIKRNREENNNKAFYFNRCLKLIFAYIVVFVLLILVKLLG